MELAKKTEIAKNLELKIKQKKSQIQILQEKIKYLEIENAKLLIEQKILEQSFLSWKIKFWR